MRTRRIGKMNKDDKIKLKSIRDDLEVIFADLTAYAAYHSADTLAEYADRLDDVLYDINDLVEGRKKDD